ncbi:MAG: cob(I)yrinic acid a,c-diamide adenosyltransferase [Candidatus Bruticola sp.]
MKTSLYDTMLTTITKKKDMIMKIVTKTGDKGQTSLINGERVPKDCKRIELCGCLDELGASIGLCLSLKLPDPFAQELEDIQRDLFRAAADSASPNGQPPFYLQENHLKQLEDRLKIHLHNIPEQRHFILCGGSQAGASLHLARTICRRTERACVALHREIEERGLLYNLTIQVYLNRLSDYLFAVARLVNKLQNCPEKKV